MHTCINPFFHAFIEGLRQIEFVNIVGMGKTKSYKFMKVDLASLRDLALKIKDPTGFRRRYGDLLTLLWTNVDEKLVHTLVQFYDRDYRCFTFSDIQLVPTLEAYSCLMDLSIAKGVPFTGLEHPLLLWLLPVISISIPPMFPRILSLRLTSEDSLRSIYLRKPISKPLVRTLLRLFLHYSSMGLSSFQILMTSRISMLL
jgi:hypothetical protein